MNPMLIQVISVVVAVVVTALIAVPIAGKLAVARKNREDQEKVGTAEEKARGIIDEAIKTAETKKREVLLEAKEENLKLKNERVWSCKSTRDVCCPRKKLWTERRTRWSVGKVNCQQRKRNYRKRKNRLTNYKSSAYRSWRKSPA